MKTSNMAHYVRIKTSIAAAERKRQGGEKFSAKFAFCLVPEMLAVVEAMAADLKCAPAEVVRRAIEEYAQDFRFGQGRRE